jgi:hypothetical protein
MGIIIRYIPIVLSICLLTALLLACPGPSDSPQGIATPGHEGGEYWFVALNIRESSIGSTMDEIFNSTTIISSWGSMSIDHSTGQWTIYPGAMYNSSTAPYGMARHAHRLTVWDEAKEEGYFNPVEPSFSPGEPYTGTYTLDGNRAFLNDPGSGIINGAFSKDYLSFVGMNMEGQDSEFFYALRKPSRAPSFNPGGKYLLPNYPALDLVYAAVHPNTGVLNGMDRFSTTHKFNVIDNALNKMMEWGISIPFSPSYDGANNLLGWSSDGPGEQASIHASLLLGLGSFRADGLVGVPGRFMAMGWNGSVLFAGSTEEEEGGAHYIRSGYMLDLDPSPTISDLEGTWLFADHEYKVEEGADPGWSDADEKLNLYNPLIESTIDASGNTIGNRLANKNVFEGIVNGTEAGNEGKVTLAEECYKPDTSLYAADCTGGVVIPVFYVNSVDADGNYLPDPPARVVLDRTHNLAAIWMPLDQGGVPCDEDTSPNCSDAMTEFLFGLGVKYE